MMKGKNMRKILLVSGSLVALSSINNAALEIDGIKANVEGSVAAQVVTTLDAKLNQSVQMSTEVQTDRSGNKKYQTFSIHSSVGLDGETNEVRKLSKEEIFEKATGRHYVIQYKENTNREIYFVKEYNPDNSYAVMYYGEGARAIILVENYDKNGALKNTTSYIEGKRYKTANYSFGLPTGVETYYTCGSILKNVQLFEMNDTGFYTGFMTTTHYNEKGLNPRTAKAQVVDQLSDTENKIILNDGSFAVLNLETKTMKFYDAKKKRTDFIYMDGASRVVEFTEIDGSDVKKRFHPVSDIVAEETKTNAKQKYTIRFDTSGDMTFELTENFANGVFTLNHRLENDSIQTETGRLDELEEVLASLDSTN